MSDWHWPGIGSTVWHKASDMPARVTGSSPDLVTVEKPSGRIASIPRREFIREWRA